MAPEQQTIFDTLTQDIKQAKWVDLIVFAVIAYGPSLVAFILKKFEKDKVEALYKLRLQDKDAVIVAQGDRIKALEESSLKRQRK